MVGQVCEVAGAKRKAETASATAQRVFEGRDGLDGTVALLVRTGCAVVTANLAASCAVTVGGGDGSF